MPDLEFQRRLITLNSPEVQISLVSDASKKSAIVEVLSRSRFQAFSNPAFRKELAHYKRTNFTRDPLGMPGFTMGFSNPASLFTPTFIRLVNIMKFVGKSEDLLFSTTPLFCIVGSAHNEQRDWIQTGRTVQRILLEAQRHNIQSAVSAVPPDPGVLQTILKSTARPQLFIRLGYTDHISPHAPRLTVDRVIT